MRMPELRALYVRLLSRLETRALDDRQLRQTGGGLRRANQCAPMKDERLWHARAVLDGARLTAGTAQLCANMRGRESVETSTEPTYKEKQAKVGIMTQKQRQC